MIDAIEIEIGEHIEVRIEREKVKEIASELTVDEVFDMVLYNIDKRKYTAQSVFERFVSDHPEKFKNLLHKFWNRKSDACPLECTEHESQLN